MKKIALPIISSLVFFFAACSNDNPSKNSGDEQVPQPVTNSGPETEAARANEAVKDSANTQNNKDSVATNAADKK